MSAVSKVLSDIWYNPSSKAAFGGANRLLAEGRQHVKNLKKTQVTKWLQNQDVYTLHKTSKNRIKRNPIISYSIDQCWFADLLDMSSLWRQNAGIRFLLVVVDVFSQFLFVESLKNKKADTVLNAFIKIRTDTNRMCSLLATDQVILSS